MRRKARIEQPRKTDGQAETRAWPFPWSRPSIEDGLVLVAVLAVPFVLHVELEHGTRSLLATNVPVVDLLIWVATAYMFACALITKFRRYYGKGKRHHERLWRNVTPWSIGCVELWLFVTVVGLSHLGSGSGGAGISELIQCVDYYILLFWLVAHSIRRGNYLVINGTVLFAVALSLVAGYQVWAGTQSFAVRSLFRNHQNYVAAFVMTGPLMWCLLTSSSVEIVRGIGHVVTAVGCCCLGSLSGMCLFLVQACFVSWSLGGEWLRRFAWLAGVLVGVVVFLTPSGFFSNVWRSQHWIKVPLAERRLEVQLAKAYENVPPKMVHFGVGDLHWFVGSNFQKWTQIKTFTPPRHAASEQSEFVIPEYYPASWSAVSAINKAPLFGHGLGRASEQIVTGYGTTERTGTSFPSTENGYLTLAVGTGMIGLSAWFLALRRVIMQALGRTWFSRRHLGQQLRSASLAGLAGAAVVMFVCPFTTQSVAALWAVLAATSFGRGTARRTTSGASNTGVTRE